MRILRDVDRKVNDDITAFLPADTDTRRGLTVMEEEFVTYADAKVMLANTTYERAEAVAEEIRALEHVTGVELDDSPAHFVNSAALLTVSFDTEADDPRAEADMDAIRAMTASSPCVCAGRRAGGFTCCRTARQSRTASRATGAISCLLWKTAAR